MKKIIFTLIASAFILVSCGGPKEPLDIINPDAEFRYFFGATCPHCQELNRIAGENDIYSRISIEKREVYGNDENRQLFLELIEELDAESSGVPFVYDTVTGKYAVWVRPALELMTSRLNQEQTEVADTMTASGDTVEVETTETSSGTTESAQ